MSSNGLAHLIGLTALVETGGAEATGSVTAVDDVYVTITCDEESWAGTDIHSVQVSVFGGQALYRLTGDVAIKELDVVLGPDPHMETIQRRKWPRRRLDLPVTVCPVEDGRRVGGIPGRTVDVGVGGVCIETLRPVEGEGDPMLIMSLPDGTTIVSLTSTVGVEDLGDGWRYRLAFRDLDTLDAGRLAELVG